MEEEALSVADERRTHKVSFADDCAASDSGEDAACVPKSTAAVERQRTSVDTIRRSECRVLLGIQPPDHGNLSWHMLFTYADEKSASEGSSYLHEVRQSLSVASATSAPCTPQDMVSVVVSHILKRDGVQAVTWAMRVVRFDHQHRSHLWSYVFDIAFTRRGCVPTIIAALGALLHLYVDHDKFMRLASSAVESVTRRKCTHSADLCVAKAVSILCTMPEDVRCMALFVKVFGAEPYPPLMTNLPVHNYVREIMSRASACRDDSVTGVASSIKALGNSCVASMRRTVVGPTVRSEELPSESVFTHEDDERDIAAKSEDHIVAVDADDAKRKKAKAKKQASSIHAHILPGDRQRVVATADESESTGIVSILSTLSLTLQSMIYQEGAVNNALGAAREGAQANALYELFMDSKGKPTKESMMLLPFAASLGIAAFDVMRARGIQMRPAYPSAGGDCVYPGPCMHYHHLVERDMMQMQQYVSSKWRDCSTEMLKHRYALCKHALVSASAHARIQGTDAQNVWNTSPRSAAWSLLLEASRSDPCCLALVAVCVSICSRSIVRNPAVPFLLCLYVLHMRSVGGGRWFEASAGDAHFSEICSQIADGDDAAFNRLGAVALESLKAVPPQLSKQGLPAKCPRSLRSCVGVCPKAFYKACTAEAIVCYVEQLEQCGADVMLAGRAFGGAGESEDPLVCQLEVFGRRIALGSAHLASCSSSRATRATCVMQSTFHGTLLAYQRNVFVNICLMRGPGSGNVMHTLLPSEREAHEDVMHGSTDSNSEKRVRMIILRERVRRSTLRSMSDVVAVGDDKISDDENDAAICPEFPEIAISKRAASSRGGTDGAVHRGLLMKKAPVHAQGGLCDDTSGAGSAGEEEGDKVLVVSDRNYKMDLDMLTLNAPLLVPSSKLYCMKELEKRGHKFTYDVLPRKLKPSSKPKSTKSASSKTPSAVNTESRIDHRAPARMSTRIFLQKCEVGDGDEATTDRKRRQPCLDFAYLAAQEQTEAT